MIPAEALAQQAEKSKLPESQLARALLSSDRPSRADVWCGKRKHRMARVYEIPGGSPVLAVRGFVTLRAQVYRDVPADDTSEVVFVDWAYPIPATAEDCPSASIILRCKCSHWWTSVRQVREQLDHLPPGDRWLMVSISRRPDDSHRGMTTRQ